MREGAVSSWEDFRGQHERGEVRAHFEWTLCKNVHNRHRCGDVVAFEENEEKACDEEERHKAEEAHYLEEARRMELYKSYYDCTSDEGATAH